MTAVAPKSVPGRISHPLVELAQTLATLPPPPGEGWDEDDRFDTADPAASRFEPDPSYDEGAEIKRGNPKGYIEHYRPYSKTKQTIRQVKQILEANADHLPLTVRQIFYRMVAEHGWNKKQDGELYDVLKNARRARWIPFEAIRDDGIIGGEPGHLDGVRSWVESVKESARNYRRNRQLEQPYRIELWCEAAGMIPQLRRVADEYSVPVFSCSGFNSLTATRDVANRILWHGLHEATPTVILHVGDFDPSGTTLFRAFAEDVGRFVRADRKYRYRQELYPVRVALTLEQIETDDLIRNPFDRVKAKQNRHPHIRGWEHDFTVQAEALPPARLAEIVTVAILAWLQQAPYERQSFAEKSDLARISQKAARI